MLKKNNSTENNEEIIKQYEEKMSELAGQLEALKNENLILQSQRNLIGSDLHEEGINLRKEENTTI